MPARPSPHEPEQPRLQSPQGARRTDRRAQRHPRGETTRPLAAGGQQRVAAAAPPDRRRALGARTERLRPDAARRSDARAAAGGDRAGRNPRRRRAAVRPGQGGRRLPAVDARPPEHRGGAGAAGAVTKGRAGRGAARHHRRAPARARTARRRPHRLRARLVRREAGALRRRIDDGGEPILRLPPRSSDPAARQEFRHQGGAVLSARRGQRQRPGQRHLRRIAQAQRVGAQGAGGGDQFHRGAERCSATAT